VASSEHSSPIAGRLLSSGFLFVRNREHRRTVESFRSAVSVNTDQTIQRQPILSDATFARLILLVHRAPNPSLARVARAGTLLAFQPEGADQRKGPICGRRSGLSGLRCRADHSYHRANLFRPAFSARPQMLQANFHPCGSSLKLHPSWWQIFTRFDAHPRTMDKTRGPLSLCGRGPLGGNSER
jgi:hypothetical protein